MIHGGRQLEWLTGGYLPAILHEVVHTEQTEEFKQQAIKEGRSLWRVSTPMFCHVEGNMSLRPFEKFRTPEAEKKYPDITSNQHYQMELDSYRKGKA